MAINVFDKMILIKDPDDGYLPGAPYMTDELLRKLDDMLNEYNVPHAFTLPYFDGPDPDPDNAAIRMFYRGEDTVTVELLYCLFSHVYRSVPDEKIYACFAKKARRLEVNE